MTDERATPQRRRSGRPSWLLAPCPPWCTREHLEDDHPEDRTHEDDGVVITAVVGDIDPDTLRPSSRPVELVVRRFRSTSEEHPDWVAILDTEDTRTRLVLTEQSAARLRRALTRE